MTYKLMITSRARRDVENIVDYIEENDSPADAQYVNDRIEDAILGLAEMPHRGRRVPETRGLATGDCREVFFKPYRIIYTIWADHVYVIAVADGRRNIEDVILRRVQQRRSK